VRLQYCDSAGARQTRRKEFEDHINLDFRECEAVVCDIVRGCVVEGVVVVPCYGGRVGVPRAREALGSFHQPCT
jgi:hypothetical protein